MLYGPLLISSCPSLTVTVPLQFLPRCARAHIVKSNPASVSSAPTQNDHAETGRKRQPRNGTGNLVGDTRIAATTIGTMCESRERRDSRLAVALTLCDAAHQ